MGQKNALVDKTGGFEGVFKNLFGHSFLFSKSDETWRAKRKATAHAFYKERVFRMLESLKDKVIKAQGRWMDEIEASTDGSTVIDLSTDIAKISNEFIT